MSNDITPVDALTMIRDRLTGAAMAVPVDQPIVMTRYDVWSMAVAIGDLVDRVDALAEGSAAADRIARELRIEQAVSAQLRLQVEALRRGIVPTSPTDITMFRSRCQWPVRPSPEKSRAERAHRRGEVVDLTEELRREQRDTGRPVPPTGGDAA